jgi:hypothetical protein
MTGALLGRTKHHGKSQTQKEKSCKERGRDWSDAATSQGMPRNANHRQGWEEARKGSPLQVLEGV